MMSRGPDDFTEQELLKISRPVDPSFLPKDRDTNWIKGNDGKCCQGSLCLGNISINPYNNI